MALRVVSVGRRSTTSTKQRTPPSFSSHHDFYCRNRSHFSPLFNQLLVKQTERRTLATATATPNPPLELKTTAPPPKEFINTNDFFKNRKILLIGVVGAFTGVCDAQLPQYAQRLDQFKAAGINEIAAVSVNDPSVMKAFAKSIDVPHDKILMLADFDGAFTRSLGMEVDLTVAKLGKRSKRYAMVIDNGKIAKQFVEEKPGELTVTKAENVLENLED